MLSNSMCDGWFEGPCQRSRDRNSRLNYLIALLIIRNHGTLQPIMKQITAWSPGKIEALSIQPLSVRNFSNTDIRGLIFSTLVQSTAKLFSLHPNKFPGVWSYEKSHRILFCCFSYFHPARRAFSYGTYALYRLLSAKKKRLKRLCLQGELLLII